MKVVINDIEYLIDNADYLIQPAEFQEIEEYLSTFYDIARDYKLQILQVHDYLPRLRATFNAETLYKFEPDRRPMFEVLTGKRALGLSPPSTIWIPHFCSRRLHFT